LAQCPKFLYTIHYTTLLNSKSDDKTDTSSHKHCIVIIDDEVDLLLVYRKALELSGLTVSAFGDPLEALEEFRTNFSKYNLVMTDIRMPHMNGYELINEFKKINPLIKVIFISAHNVSKSDIISKLADGIVIDKFIEKPVSLERLNQVVQSILKNS
jgi:DNA-binding NtrC family response regulator